MMPLRRAAMVIRAGGVVACPTEGVFGFSCAPDEPEAILHILDIKQRDVMAGLLLIAADVAQLEGWAALPPDTPDLRSTADRPVTWVVPAAEAVSGLIRGRHDSVAVRITEHPVAAELCRLSDMPLISTSANIAGRPPARTPYVLRRQFRQLVDCIVPGACGPASGPSEIRDLESGRVLRPAE